MQFKLKTNNNWYDILQYTAVLLVAAAIPVKWRFGLLASLVLGVTTVVKIVSQRKIGNPNLQPLSVIALCSPIIYWAVLVFSLLWSRDLNMGWELVTRKAILLVFPLCFLLSDTSYFSFRKLRGIGYALLVSVCGVFFCFIIAANIAKLQGVGFLSFYNDYISQNHRHHAYSAMYVVVAIFFVYYELYTYWTWLKAWQKIVLLFAVVTLVVDVVLVNSRAGIVVMLVSVLVCILHLAITKHSWRLGLGVGSLFLSVLAGATHLIPSYTNRVSETIKDYQEDTRTSIYRCNWHAVCKSPVIGYGIGDAHAAQVKTYKEEKFEAGINSGYNAHNQYLDSMLSAGFFGLLSLFFFLLSSEIVALWNRSHFTFWITVLSGIVIINLLFESMLERQMGLLFIGGLYSVMILLLSTEAKRY